MDIRPLFMSTPNLVIPQTRCPGLTTSRGSRTVLISLVMPAVAALWMTSRFQAKNTPNPVVLPP